MDYEENKKIELPELPEIDKEIFEKLSPYSRAFIKLIEKLKKEQNSKR